MGGELISDFEMKRFCWSSGFKHTGCLITNNFTIETWDVSVTADVDVKQNTEH